MNLNVGASSRQSFLTCLCAMTFASSARAETARWGNGPPLLRTACSQFIELRPSNEVPDLMLGCAEGKKIALNAFRGKAVLVYFWATWFPPCRRELPAAGRPQANHARAIAGDSGGLDRSGRTAGRGRVSEAPWRQWAASLP
jgi:thiol-disulfide isomerase/thioredoxin